VAVLPRARGRRGRDPACGNVLRTPHPHGPTTARRHDEQRELVLEERHCDQLRLLLDGHTEDIESPDERGRTRLHRAVARGAEHAVAALLATGADLDSADAWGNTPLWLAIYHHHEGSAIAELLIGRRADPCIQNHHGITALGLAHALSTDDPAVAALLPLLTATAPAMTDGDGEPA
jgi:ankyrin repeat protein